VAALRKRLAAGEAGAAMKSPG